jgi:hypothetical protein
MLKVNDVVHFSMTIGKKGMGFELKQTGSLTITESMTKETLKEILAEDFLEEVNEKLFEVNLPKFSKQDTHVRLLTVV